MSDYGANAEISGSLTVTGSSTFNQDSADVDFRVESDDNQYMLVVDAGTNRVGIGVESPQKDLHVQRTSGETTLRLQSAGYYSDILQTGANLFIQNAAGGGNIIFYDDAAERMRIDTDGNVGIGTNDPDYALDVAGDVGVNEYIYHNDDTDTFIRFEADEINIRAGGEKMIFIVEGAGGDQADKVTINDDLADIDFQVKGDNETNLFRTDAANDRVGIGTSAPDCRLHVTGATGDIFKIENSTAYGVTYGQLVKTDLTIASAGSSPIDTTLNLPAGALIDTLIVKLTTVGVVSSGTDYQLTNITVDNGIQPGTLFSASFTDFSLIGDGSSIVSGTMYYFNNIQPYYPAGGLGYLWTAGTNDIKLNFSDANVTTDAIMDVAVYYRKFDLVR